MNKSSLKTGPITFSHTYLNTNSSMYNISISSLIEINGSARAYFKSLDKTSKYLFMPKQNSYMAMNDNVTDSDDNDAVIIFENVSDRFSIILCMTLRLSKGAITSMQGDCCGFVVKK